MIYVKSFVGTRTLDKVSTREDIEHAVQEATEGMQKWAGNAKVISVSTQLVANERFVSYAITAVAEQSKGEK